MPSQNARDGKSNIAPRLTAEHALTITATFRMYDGYGSMGVYMALGMERGGASVNIIPLILDLKETPVGFQQIYQASQPDVVGPVLYFCGPCKWMDPYVDVEDLFINTMWEADRLPASWAARLNRARAVIVPSRFLVDVCRTSGVSVPVEVVAQGVDPEVYHYQERTERPGITSLIVGTVDDRKHMDVAINAWKIAFTDDPAARLIIKSRFGKGDFIFDDPRISFTNNSEVTRGIPHWYARADLLLALGNEGFGLPVVEGMATGLPVIALNSEGQADICEDARGLILPVSPARWEPCNDEYWGPAGKRALPGVDEVVEHLRWVAAHRDEAREMGRAASRWALKHRNVWTMGPAVLDIMERYSQSARPLRLRLFAPLGEPAHYERRKEAEAQS